MWHVLGFGQINNSNPNVCDLSPFAELKSLLLMKFDCVCVVNINPNIPTLFLCQNHSKSIISDHHQAWCRFSSFCNKSFCTASAREASYSTWRSRSSPRYLLGELRGGKRVRLLDMDGSWTWVWLAMVDYGSIFFGVDPAISCSIHAISRLFSHMATVVSIVFQEGMSASNLQVPLTKVTFGFLWKIFGTSRMLRKLVCNKILKNLKLGNSET